MPFAPAEGIGHVIPFRMPGAGRSYTSVLVLRRCSGTAHVPPTGNGDPSAGFANMGINGGGGAGGGGRGGGGGGGGDRPSPLAASGEKVRLEHQGRIRSRTDSFD